MLGAGLAMDAFSVSCANALREPDMKPLRMARIAGVYALFQFLMPMAGWVCVHTIREHFTAIQGVIPWIALVLLGWIGGSMILEGIRHSEESGETAPLTVGVLLLQGIATSIDALSVGFTIDGYGFSMALTACLIIGGVTFVICTAGLMIGKKAGNWLTKGAGILGGVILIAIGLEIVVTHYI